MFSNYFYLLRSVHELNKKVCGLKIYDIFSQEKNTIFFSIPNNEYQYQHLLISNNPQSPFLQIKKEHRKAKKNAIQFFSKLQSSIIQKVEIASKDRVIKFTLDNGEIYFSIRGNKTNVFYVDDNEVTSFKKSNAPILEYNNLNFTNNLEFTLLNKDTCEYEDIKDLRKSYPMISSEIKNEIQFRKSLKQDLSIKNIFSKIITEIFEQNISVGFNTDLGKVIFIPQTFQSLKIDNNLKIFEDYNLALHYYLSTFYRITNKEVITKSLEKYFDKQLSSLANKLNKLKYRVEQGSNSDKYYEQANLLLSNIYQLKKGTDSITLTNYKDNSEIKLKLDPKLSPKENVDKLFEKAKDEKVNYNKSVELFNITKENYEALQKDYEKYQSTNDIKEIEKLSKKILPKEKKIIKMDSGLKFKYWHYLIDDKYHVYVGRDSKSNDYLSIKFAKQNDYWFHARGLPGSHVVLRVENTKEVMPKDIIKKTAAIAAYYSKAKTAGTASVSYTFAKFVYKKKGMLPGKVMLTKEKTILVKPDIHKDCELQDE